MKNKDHDIFDEGFDRFLHRGDDLPIADIHRPLPEQNKMDIQKKTTSAMLNRAQYKNNILYFADKEIDFNNKPNQKDLLETLFKKPKNKWFYDEIMEDWDITGEGILEEDYWRKFYNAGDDINTAVAIKTGIENFIIKNTKEIKINPKYV